MAVQHSRIGLGCSSFSFFFDAAESNEELTPDSPRVQEWMETVHFAIENGITVLDTAPWYGHGSSECVIGWAIQKYNIDRSRFILNTKVGRYEADPAKQFDFSRETTMVSAQRSLKRMNVAFVDVLQLHDPEFAPSLTQLLDETIPALLDCKKNGWCKEIGITGYPLQVQHQILQAAIEKFGTNVFDQALTYSHFNLHDRSLFQPKFNSKSYFEATQDMGIRLLAAAPLSMGLLTHSDPPAWHPASPNLKKACNVAAKIAEENGVSLVDIAFIFALIEKRIPCTILGMKDTNQVKVALGLQQRVEAGNFNVREILSQSELVVLDTINNSDSGPFASVWKDRDFEWDGVNEAAKFWSQLPEREVHAWQMK